LRPVSRRLTLCLPSRRRLRLPFHASAGWRRHVRGGEGARRRRV